MATSCFLYCRKPKPMILITNAQSKRMIRALPQPYVKPPRCRARRSDVMPGTKMSVPKRLSFLIFSFRGRISMGFICGFSRNKPIVKKVPNLKGILIQKHHRQFSFVVRTPPRTGPATEVSNFAVPAKPPQSARCRSGTHCVPMTKIPDDAKQQIALPATRAGDVGTSAQSRLLHSKIAREIRTIVFVLNML